MYFIGILTTALLTGSTAVLPTTGPIEAPEVAAVAQHVCDTIAQGGDPVAEIMGTHWGDQRTAEAITVVGVQQLCPELGLSVSDRDTISQVRVDQLRRMGWYGVAADGAEVLYPPA
jgi:hypothetical protein